MNGIELFFGLIGAFVLCGIILVCLNKRGDSNIQNNEKMKVLYCSNDRNSYAKAKDVIKILQDANVEPNFLGYKE